jgi:prophage regulatory protein
MRKHSPPGPSSVPQPPAQSVDLVAPRVLRMKELERVTGLKRPSIYERVAAGTFPKPIKLGGGQRGASAVGWLEHEVLDWLRERIAERDRRAA